MSVSIEKLRAEAEATGFRVDVLAKVVRLMSVLRGVRDHPFLKGRLALKGGTALNGSIVLSRRQATLPGVVDLVELSTGGDTLWTRRIQLPLIPLTEDSVNARVEEMATMIAQAAGHDIASPQLKRRIRDSWTIPEYWPAVRQIRLMSNGDIWFRPPGSDDRRIWYAVRKGEEEGAIRRVIAPEWFVPHDVNDTHMWGVRRDEMEVAYVVGLRLERGVGE